MVMRIPFPRAACLAVLMAGVFLTMAGTARAQVPSTASTGVGAQVPGCNPTVAQAQAQVAQARVAADKAMIDEMIDQPVSIPMVTCQNQAAGVSASLGGSVFSGDFTEELMPVVGSALQSFSLNFEGALQSLFSGGGFDDVLGSLFGSGASASLPTEYNCDAMQRTWEAQQNQGIRPTVQVPTLADLLSGQVPSVGGGKFDSSWQAAREKGVFANAKTAVDALPRADVPSFAADDSLCDVLARLGKGEGCRDVQ